MNALDLEDHSLANGAVLLTKVPDGGEAVVINQLMADLDGKPLIFVARDDARAARIMKTLSFLRPDVKTQWFPAWDCLPYDRVSPNREIAAQRIATLTLLANRGDKLFKKPFVLFTTINAFTQKLPTKDRFQGALKKLSIGDVVPTEELVAFLEGHGYLRSSTVVDPGDYAVRGGIVDIFPAGHSRPYRLDFFGDELDTVRVFDPLSQRTVKEEKSVTISPVAEYPKDEESRELFRSRYREMFGISRQEDPLYESVSAGRHYAGIEHWLPLFYPEMTFLHDYVPGAALVLDQQVGDAKTTRLEAIADFYDARKTFLNQNGAGFEDSYKPIPPKMLYSDEEDWDALGLSHQIWQITSYAIPSAAGREVVDPGIRVGLDFSEARQNPEISFYRQVVIDMREAQAEGRRVVVSALSEGSKTRLINLLSENGLPDAPEVTSLVELMELRKKAIAFTVLPQERGFRSEKLIFVTEQDILGERMVRPQSRRRKADNFLKEVSSIEIGDIVVHMDHGIGRYEGLEVLEIGGAAHDVLKLVYHGDDKLFLPIENIDLLSRYGNEEGAQLDRLGSANWQARKSQVKKNLRAIAADLMKIAAARHLKKGPEIQEPDAGYGEFCDKFPFAETEDQIRAIDETIQDMLEERPMDRLVCGDVGFGKTEIALRAAFVAALSGWQVAVVVPTTLLSRQHFNNFKERFEGFPVRIAQLSRLVSQKDQNLSKAEIKDGKVDIVIGTHSLLSGAVDFDRLGLLIIDEEQRFGVKQKERLKELRETIHVLTLTATPIPRTLQLALSGVKELSLISTPPVDRLSVRTFVMPWDAMIVREALMREHFRGGQSFVVCPRLRDLEQLQERIATIAPELKVCVAHGQLTPANLEETMTDFYDRKYDVLLSTNIVESGLDIPTVNTLIIYKADMFGLSGLYQLRGRVGRSKLRGYAYLTLSPNRRLTDNARRRLEVMQTLDGLGAGFSLASHDLDIRGAGNLVGEEQSGHVREVGIELYQQLLEEAVNNHNMAPEEKLKALEDSWSPQINLGITVMIPDNYVTDLSVRLGLYRRLGGLDSKAEIDYFAAELIDRFGELPKEVDNLLQVVQIKAYCRKANVEKVEVGPKGAVITFRHNKFPKPDKLMGWIQKNGKVLTARPDQKLFYRRSFGSEEDRSEATTRVIRNLAKLAA
jgi:transcription-repair coupling factor (superfamily II helicase)